MCSKVCAVNVRVVQVSGVAARVCRHTRHSFLTAECVLLLQNVFSYYRTWQPGSAGTSARGIARMEGWVGRVEKGAGREGRKAGGRGRVEGRGGGREGGGGARGIAFIRWSC